MTSQVYDSHKKGDGFFVFGSCTQVYTETAKRHQHIETPGYLDMPRFRRGEPTPSTRAHFSSSVRDAAHRPGFEPGRKREASENCHGTQLTAPPSYPEPDRAARLFTRKHVFGIPDVYSGHCNPPVSAHSTQAPNPSGFGPLYIPPPMRTPHGKANFRPLRLFAQCQGISHFSKNKTSTHAGRTWTFPWKEYPHQQATSQHVCSVDSPRIELGSRHAPSETRYVRGLV